MRFLWLTTLILALFMVQYLDACFNSGKSSSSSSSASASAGNGIGNRGSFEDSNSNFQGQSVSVGVQCDSSGNCKKYENSQTWG